jgi:hypothetical protein
VKEEVACDEILTAHGKENKKKKITRRIIEPECEYAHIPELGC